MKKWRDVTQSEINHIKRKKCRHCRYSSGTTTYVGNITCDYILIERHRRGCGPEKCDKFIDRRAKVEKRC